jgi:hypothetical protein
MNRRGVGSLAIILIVVIVAAFIAGGFWYYESHQSGSANQSTASSITSTSTSVASNTRTITLSSSISSIVQPNGYATIIPASSTGFLVFDDTPEGYQFQFPANLITNDNGTISFPGENTAIEWYVGFPSVDPIKDYIQAGDSSYKPPAGATSTDVINGMAWTRFTIPDASGYYTNSDGVGVEFDEAGTVNPLLDNSQPFSDADNQILHGILSTFTFTDPSLRIDNKLAQIKVGDQYGNLKVSRVITGPNAEVDFVGQLTLTGLIDDVGGGHAGPRYVLDHLDTSSIAELPQVGYRIRYDSNFPLEIYFNNQGFVGSAGGDEFAFDQVTSTVVLDNFQEFPYGPGGYDYSSFPSANLVKSL